MTDSPIGLADAAVDIGADGVEAATAPLDEVCAAAVDLARDAAAETARPSAVGEYVGAEADGEHIVTHYFGSTDRGYVGWRWAVTVVRLADSTDVTVDEVVLLPGPGALLAPPWVPWSDRLQAGDLGVGDLLPTAADDQRLVPGYTGIAPHGDGDLDVDAVEAVVDELWLGRPRVISEYGRDLAAERWYEGDQGPEAAIARAAELPCASCGFLVLMSGALSRLFGVCANEYAPDDGRVVSFDHGCGAHSEALVVHTEPLRDEPEPVPDTAPDSVDSIDEVDAVDSIDEVDAVDGVEPTVADNGDGPPDPLSI